MSARRFILLFGIFAAFLGNLRAEKTSNWRVFRAQDGLADSVVTSVAISQRTNVITAHSDFSALTRFDGFQFTQIRTASPMKSRAYENRIGQIWTVSPEGLQLLNGAAWSDFPIKKIQDEYRTNAARVVHSVSLAPVKQGRVLFLVSDELDELNQDPVSHEEIAVIRHANQTPLRRFNEMIATRDGTVWIAAERGLARLPLTRSTPNDSGWEDFVLPQELGIHNLHEPLADETGVTTVGESLEDGAKVIVHFDGQRWATFSTEKQNISHAWLGLGGVFWATDGETLFWRAPGAIDFVENEEISAARYFDVATEPNGVFWLATSEGLFRYSPPAWRISPEIQPVNGAVQNISEDAEGRIWFSTANALHALHNERLASFPLPENSGRNAALGETLFSLRDGRFVREMRGRLLIFDPKTENFSQISHPSKQRVKLLGLLKNGKALVQVSPSSNAIRLETFDGSIFEPFHEPAPVVKPGTELLFVFAAGNGEFWLETTRGLMLLRGGKWQFFDPSDGAAPESVSCLAEISEGKIWCGSRDRIWEFNGQKWSSPRSGFDRVNDILKARDGSVWIASNSGLHRFFQGDWTVNGADEGLNSTVVTQVFEDRRGRVWAGTSRGLSRYFPEADSSPPQSSISGRTVANDGTISINFTAQDKWKFTPPELLLFSHRIDDQDWSPFGTQKSVSFMDLEPGKHYFKVRAMDRNWNIDPEPALLEFEVPLPWFRETRLILISVAGLSGVLFFAALAINRHRRLVRSYAEVEKMVALRTRQLEEAHSKLLHSEKMNALGTLAAGIAHDFNSILSIIKGSAQIIETNLDDEEKIRTRLDRIKTVVDQGTGIVKAMLGFSRPTEKELVCCDINALADETVKLLGDRFQRGISVLLEPGKPLPEILGSRDFIQQILINFIFNAADALNGEGKIILRTEQKTWLPSNPVLTPDTASAYVFISVQDFGVGIAPEILPRIFEPFFTTKAFSSRRGTGLGLSTAYEMAKNMNCGLMVESEPGRGSTFTLIIPVREKTTGDFPPQQQEKRA